MAGQTYVFDDSKLEEAGVRYVEEGAGDCMTGNTGMRWATNGLVNRLIYPDSLMPGWSFGRCGLRIPLALAFDRRVLPVTESGCWIWIGRIHYKTGYGIFGEDATGAHRLSWQLHRGQIPEGLYVLHRCDVRCCVNPDHLFLGTHADNMADMVAKGIPSGRRSPKYGQREEKCAL